MVEIKGVAIKFKSKYAQIVTWHCLNHRLQLGVSDAMKSVERVSPIESFFPKSMLFMHSLRSCKEKYKR